MTTTAYGDMVQYGRQADGDWTWFCPRCGAWGSHPRLSFVFTEYETHRKVVHHA